MRQGVDTEEEAAVKEVLIVEDEAHVVRVLKVALEKANYRVESAPDGEAALTRLRDRHPDALITDIQMPRMSGEEMCFRIEKEMPERSFPIVVTTSKTGMECRAWAAKMSNVFFMEKPMSIRKLLSTLEGYFTEFEGSP